MSKKLKDHRQIGKELDLFSFHEIAPGAVFWHPKGWVIYQEITALLRSMLAKSGYQEIKTPVMVRSELFKKSGHWKHFGERNMFNLSIKDDQSSSSLYSLKPMNCPESTRIFNACTRSYKDLPIKFSEFGILHRNELSGVLGGLFRLREFTIDDAHIYCTQEQIQEVVGELLKQILAFYKIFGFKLSFYLSTKPDKALEIANKPTLWADAEKDLDASLTGLGIKFNVKEKDGAFYGPKIDFHMTDSQERDWQLATVQLDF
ncbi:MAG: aminoacyl--tRNA ligase-related protein, partial [Candidatus Paceibacterota bacterium]